MPLQQARLTVASLTSRVCADLLTLALISINRALCLPAHISKPITCCVCVCVCWGPEEGQNQSRSWCVWYNGACEEFQLSLCDRPSLDVKRCGRQGWRLRVMWLIYWVRLSQTQTVFLLLLSNAECVTPQFVCLHPSVHPSNSCISGMPLWFNWSEFGGQLTEVRSLWPHKTHFHTKDTIKCVVQMSKMG